jgi:hypothetical protein
MIMKKYVSALAVSGALIASSSAYAHDVTTVVNTGSDSGGFMAVLTMIGEQFNHKFVQAGNPVIANTHFDNKNVLTMWSTEWPGDKSLPSVVMDADTIVAVQAYETVLCSRAYSSLEEMAGQTINLATWGDSPAVTKFVNSLGTSNDITFNVVPYGGSGDTVRGYLGKDADTIFTTQTKQAKVEVDGTCFAFSANGDLDFAFVDVILSVNAEEHAVKQYRQTVEALVETEAWQTAFEGTLTQVVNAENGAAIVKKVNAAVELNTQ